MPQPKHPPEFTPMKAAAGRSRKHAPAKTAVGYIRVSDAVCSVVHRTLSEEEQRRILTWFAEKEGLTLVDLFLDKVASEDRNEGNSGDFVDPLTFVLPAWQGLTDAVSAVREGRANTLLCVGLDRLSNGSSYSHLRWLSWLSESADAGWRFLPVDGLSTDTAMGRFTDTLLSSQIQFHESLRSEMKKTTLADLLALPRYEGPTSTVSEMQEAIGDLFAEPEPLPVQAAVRLDAYGIVQRAVEEGVTRGYRRAFKHTDAPGEESIRASIEREVMDALCEVLRFD